MMYTYNVKVRHNEKPYCQYVIEAPCAMLACEQAERIACQANEGSLTNLPDYFAIIGG